MITFTKLDQRWRLGWGFQLLEWAWNKKIQKSWDCKVLAFYFFQARERRPQMIYNTFKHTSKCKPGYLMLATWTPETTFNVGSCIHITNSRHPFASLSKPTSTGLVQRCIMLSTAPKMENLANILKTEKWRFWNALSSSYHVTCKRQALAGRKPVRRKIKHIEH